MSIKKVVIAWFCAKCRYAWWPRKGKPKMCPECKSKNFLVMYDPGIHFAINDPK